MKTKSVVAMVFLTMGLLSAAMGQDLKTDVKGKIAPYPIGVSFDKTLNLIFPYSITSVDRGSRDIIIQKAKGVTNVLQLKAAAKGFKETNLTVITGEGALYSFLLKYEETPLLINVKVAELLLPVQALALGSVNEGELKDVAKRIATKSSIAGGPQHRKYDVGIALQGIYIVGDLLYIQLELWNDSYIKYDIDQFRIYIRDRKKAKRTASQEIEKLPQYIEGNVTHIEGVSRQTVVVVIDKFTIPDKKYLRLELMERNGGRHLAIRLLNRHLIRAKAF